MFSTTAEVTVQALRFVFTTHGLPEETLTDNGLQLIAKEFKDFFKFNYIKHILSAPCHPASNGEAEKKVRTFIQATRVAKRDPGTLAQI